MPSPQQLDTASHLLDSTSFHRSSFCGSGGCVEVALLPDHSIAVRDAKDARLCAPVLLFNQTEWTAFLRGVEAGEFAFKALSERH